MLYEHAYLMYEFPIGGVALPLEQPCCNTPCCLLTDRFQFVEVMPKKILFLHFRCNICTTFK